jgi:hypothetical protein
MSHTDWISLSGLCSDNVFRPLGQISSALCYGDAFVLTCKLWQLFYHRRQIKSCQIRDAIFLAVSLIFHFLDAKSFLHYYQRNAVFVDGGWGTVAPVIWHLRFLSSFVISIFSLMETETLEFLSKFLDAQGKKMKWDLGKGGRRYCISSMFGEKWIQQLWWTQLMGIHLIYLDLWGLYLTKKFVCIVLKTVSLLLSIIF